MTGGRRAVVIAGLTRRSRLSIVSDDGRITDVARAFEHLEHPPLTGPNGSLYVAEQRPGDRGSKWLVYRLDPGRPAERSGSTARPAASAPAPPAADASRAVPRIAFAIKSAGFRRGRIVLVRADGRDGPRPLVAGRHNDGFCQSADGRRMAYYSDEEAPNEPFLYVAAADGSHPRKITERPVQFWCRFSSRWLLLGMRTGPALALLSHDLRTGRQTPLAEDVDRLALSPDGAKVLLVGGLDFGGKQLPSGPETLEVLDLATGRRTRLAGPLAGASFGHLPADDTLLWSPDGSRVAYTVGPTPYFIRASRLRASRRKRPAPADPQRRRPALVVTRRQSDRVRERPWLRSGDLRDERGRERPAQAHRQPRRGPATQLAARAPRLTPATTDGSVPAATTWLLHRDLPRGEEDG